MDHGRAVVRIDSDMKEQQVGALLTRVWITCVVSSVMYGVLGQSIVQYLCNWADQAHNNNNK